MIVYLLHYPEGELGHYLGMAPSEVSIDPLVVPHGRGWRQTPENGKQPVIADVWEAASTVGARAIYETLRRQGSRRRLCSICNPGNARGAGRGNWERQPPEGAVDATDVEMPDVRTEGEPQEYV